MKPYQSSGVTEIICTSCPDCKPKLVEIKAPVKPSARRVVIKNGKRIILPAEPPVVESKEVPAPEITNENPNLTEGTENVPNENTGDQLPT